MSSQMETRSRSFLQKSIPNAFSKAFGKDETACCPSLLIFIREAKKHHLAHGVGWGVRLNIHQTLRSHTQTFVSTKTQDTNDTR